MAASPIRIVVELDGVEANDRFQTALDELTAATVELIEASTEVEGYRSGGLEIPQPKWTVQPSNPKYFDGAGTHVKSFSFGVERE